MRLLHSIIYGFVSGFTELIPVSGPAHQQMMKYLFGLDVHQPVLDLMVHIATLASIMIGSYNTISKIRMEQKRRLSRHRGSKTSAFYDLRIVKTASIPMIAGMLLYALLTDRSFKLPAIALGSLFFGLIFLAVDHMRQGNKNSQSVSPLDSLIMGLGCALAALPGISRIGMALTVSVARGADKDNAYTWALLLTIPALAVFCVLDLISMFTIGAGMVTFVLFLLYLLAAVFAFAGGYCAISVIHNLSARVGYSGFAYYNIGVALFSFILYLIT